MILKHKPLALYGYQKHAPAFNTINAKNIFEDGAVRPLTAAEQKALLFEQATFQSYFNLWQVLNKRINYQAITEATDLGSKRYDIKVADPTYYTVYNALDLHVDGKYAARLKIEAIAADKITVEVLSGEFKTGSQAVNISPLPIEPISVAADKLYFRWKSLVIYLSGSIRDGFFIVYPSEASYRFNTGFYYNTSTDRHLSWNPNRWYFLASENSLIFFSVGYRNDNNYRIHTLLEQDGQVYVINNSNIIYPFNVQLNHVSYGITNEPFFTDNPTVFTRQNMFRWRKQVSSINMVDVITLQYPYIVFNSMSGINKDTGKLVEVGGKPAFMIYQPYYDTNSYGRYGQWFPIG
jgi:hypothetical protein